MLRSRSGQVSERYQAISHPNWNRAAQRIAYELAISRQ